MLWLFHQLEAIFLSDVGVFGVVYFGDEHVVGAGEEGMIAVFGTVDDEVFAGFGMLGDAFDAVKITLEMAIVAADLDSSAHEDIIALLLGLC